MQEIAREQLNILEEYELPEQALEENLAVAETVLANLLVRRWLALQKPEHPPETGKQYRIPKDCNR